MQKMPSPTIRTMTKQDKRQRPQTLTPAFPCLPTPAAASAAVSCAVVMPP